MSWDELIAYNRRWVQLHEGNNHQAEAARRMTVLLDAMEALRSGDVIERAARTITPELYYHYDEWDDANDEDRTRALKMARTALAAALGEDESNE